MNDNYTSYNENAVQISIPNLMLYILRHWKGLIAAVVIGLLLGGALCAWKLPNVVSQDEVEKEKKSWAADYEVDPDVDASMKIASRYRELYEKQLEYNTNSVIVNLDAMSYYEGEVKYYIFAGSKTDLLCSLYESVVSEDSTLKSIRKEAGLDCKDQYVRELLTYGLDSELLTVGNGVNLQNGSSVEMMNEDPENGVVIQYTLVAKDKVTCEKMVESLQNIVVQKNDQYQEEYGTYNFINISNSIQRSSSNDYLSRQKGAVDALNTYLTTVQKMEKEFTGDDEKYYQTVYMNQLVDASEEVVEETPAFSKKDVLKYIVVGLFLACTCWGGTLFFRYLMDNHVKDSEELSHTWGIKVLGIKEGEEHPFWGRRILLDHIFNRRSADSDIYILSMIELLQKEHILVCGDQNNTEIQSCKQWIHKERSETELGDLLSRDSRTLELSKHKDGIILVVQLGASTYPEIIRELQVCQLQNLKILGAIVID